MVNVAITVNKSVQKHFDEVFQKYLITNTKRTIGESCNQTLLFIVRNAVNQTVASEPNKIRNDLLAASQKVSTAPLAAILVNYIRGKKNEPGLVGAEMASAVESFIKNRENKRNYIRSRWLRANKILNSVVTSKKGAAKLPTGLRIRGQTASTGGAIPAKNNWKASGKIFANIEKLRNADEAGVLLNLGLDKAVRQEIGSKLDYLIRKRLEEQVIGPFNAS